MTTYITQTWTFTMGNLDKIAEKQNEWKRSKTGLTDHAVKLHKTSSYWEITDVKLFRNYDHHMHAL